MNPGKNQSINTTARHSSNIKQFNKVQSVEATLTTYLFV